MQCAKVKKLISEYIDGELSPKIDSEVKKHLSKCEKCNVLANTLKATVLFSHEQARLIVENWGETPQSIYYSLHKVLRKEWEFYTGTKELKVKVGQLVNCPYRMYANLIEQNNTLTLIIELPGVEKENIQLIVGANTVEISGIKSRPGGTEGGSRLGGTKVAPRFILGRQAYYINEIKYGEFFREIELPYPIVPEKTKSSFKNGLLRVTMFKV